MEERVKRSMYVSFSCGVGRNNAEAGKQTGKWDQILKVGIKFTRTETKISYIDIRSSGLFTNNVPL